MSDLVHKIKDFNENKLNKSIKSLSQKDGKNVPVLCCEANKWQGKPMIRLLDYLEALFHQPNLK
jgi:hypothetical protein